MATILIVDDRPSNRDYLTALLGLSGHRLLEAADGAQALAKVRDERPDLVITDILMPTMDGYEFVQRLRADPDLATTNVIFHTANYAAPETLALAKACGVHTILPKPSELDEIIRAVNEALGVPPIAAYSAQRSAGAGSLRVPGDTVDTYLRELRAAGADIDAIAGDEPNAPVGTRGAKTLTKKLSQNVRRLQGIMSRLSSLVEVGMEMERERDPARLVRIFFGAACEIVDSGFGAVALFDDAEQVLRHLCTKGIDAKLFEDPRNVHHGLLGSTLLQPQALRVNRMDPATEAGELPAGHPAARNYLGVRVATENCIYGLIYFADKKDGSDFDNEDERLAAIMAAKLALLYENLQLYALVQRHAAKLEVETSQRARAVDALREREAGLQRAQQMARLAHVITGPDGSFESWSASLPVLLGVTPAQMPGSTREWLDLLHPDDRGLFRSKSIEAGVTRAHTELEYRLRHSAGAWVHFRQVMEPLEGPDDASGRIRWFNTIQDVTERKLAERELRRFRLAMDTSADSIYLTDTATMRFVDVNSEACRRLGYTREQLLRMGPQELLGVDTARIETEYRKLIAAGDRGLSVERVFVRSDGSREWTDLRSRASLVEGDPLIITIGRDVTERKLAEERIRRLNRVYRVLSGINSAIVRIRNRDELLSEACRIAVDAGQFPCAWIGLLDPENGRVDVVAVAGDDRGLLKLVEFNRDRRTPAGGPSLFAEALRTHRAMVCNDVENDGAQIVYRDLLLERGFRATAGLPLVVGGEAVGFMAVLAADVGTFDEEEARLLDELAGDISFSLDHIAKEERLNYLAMYDPLTGLANRTLFLERLDQFIQAAGPVGNRVAVVLADIERFRSVNESLGRRAGDAVIKELAERLMGEIGKSELARIGADQITVVLQTMEEKPEITRRIERLWQRCLAEPFRVSGAELRISAKAGVAIFPSDGAGAEVLLHNAEAALTKAKELGDRFAFYTSALTARTGEKLTLENQLWRALEQDEFVLHYQPKLGLKERRIVGVEALIRWQSPELGLVPPMQFIPLMEETGMILDVGAWALDKAIEDHLRWMNLGLPAPRVAVNVSAIQLRRPDFVATVRKALGRGATPPGIDLEITESIFMEDMESIMRKLKELRDLGVSIAIDDFGTGYSSLGYLSRLSVQTLKIDRSFIITMLDGPDTMTVVSAIISLAHSLRLKVVAEGVDNEEQARTLRLLDCDEMQGFLYSRPVPFEQMTVLLQQEK